MRGRQILRKGAAGSGALFSAGFPAEFVNPNHHSVSGRKRFSSTVIENGSGLNADLPLAAILLLGPLICTKLQGALAT